MPVTSPDNIFYLDNTNAAGLIPYSATLATSIQEALDVRSEGQQIRTYKWDDDAEQAAQSGMQPGDLGYRIDQGITYRWNGVGWSPAFPSVQQMIPASVSTGGSVSPTGTVTFSGVAGIELRGCFSAAYPLHKVEMLITTASSAVPYVNLMNGTSVDNTGYDKQRLIVTGTSVSAAQQLAASRWDMGVAAFAGSNNLSFTLADVATATPTTGQARNNALPNPLTTSGGIQDAAILHRAASARDGLRVEPSTGNISGWIKVFGYA